MSCNCGCHDDKTPATGWRKFVPLIVGVVVAGALIAGAVLKSQEKSKAANGADAKQTSAAARP
jgi:hypothetical protein